MHYNSPGLLSEIRNVGYVDRGARIALGTVAIIATMLMVSGPLGWFAVIPLAAVYPILTGVIAFDPFYYVSEFKTTDIHPVSDEAIRDLAHSLTGLKLDSQAK